MRDSCDRRDSMRSSAAADVLDVPKMIVPGTCAASPGNMTAVAAGTNDQFDPFRPLIRFNIIAATGRTCPTELGHDDSVHASLGSAGPLSPVDDLNFRDEAGDYFRATEDQASMLPMLEMSRTAKARHIPDVLIVYNRMTLHACGKVRRDEMQRIADLLRRLPP
jgi:hypothetical protein